MSDTHLTITWRLQMQFSVSRPPKRNVPSLRKPLLSAASPRTPESISVTKAKCFLQENL